MPRRTTDDDDWEDGEDEWNGADEEEDEAPEDDEEATIPCPYCRRQIHEHAQRCPYCEKYISEEDAPPSRKPWWIILGVLLGLYVVYRWITG